MRPYSFLIILSLCHLNYCVSQCTTELLYDFEANIDPWESNMTYSHGQSGTSFESSFSLFAKMELEPNGSYLRKGVFTKFINVVQDWSQFESMRFDFKFVDLATDPTTIGRPPARPNGSRVIYIELIEQGGEKFKYEFYDNNNDWHQREVDFSDFVRRGGSDNPAGDGILNLAAITNFAFHVHSVDDSFTEVFRFDDIELLFKPEFCPVIPLLSDIAEVFHLPKGAPKYSDVCLTSRYRRFYNHDKYQQSTVEAIHAFHPTRLDWTYINDKGFITDSIIPLGLQYSGTLNTKLPDVVNGSERSLGRCMDAAGQKFIWPWMDQDGGQYVGSVNEQDFKDIYMNHARRYYENLDTNFLVAIQMDEPGFNYLLALNNDACYVIGDGYETHSEAFQSTEVFYQDMQDLIVAESNNPNLGFSMNNDGSRFNDRVMVNSFDFAMGELYSHFSNPDSLYQISSRAKSLSKIQIFSPVRYRPDDDEYNDDDPLDFYYNANDKDHIRTGRQSIATAYAVGANHFVPWDTWFHGSIRHFGLPRDYADLFGFVRAIPFFLDGYEDAAFYTPNPSISDLRFNGNYPVEITADNGEVSAFARAKPNDPNAPIVIHLINWGDNVTNAIVQLHHHYFSTDGNYSAALLKPISYDALIHEQARDSAEILLDLVRGDYQYSAYADLMQTTALSHTVLDQSSSEIAVSSLDVWGIVVITPTQECKDEFIESDNQLITLDQYLAVKIETNGTVATGGNVKYTAGESIELITGFQVKKSAVFHAYIDSCN